jgi:hypothetical protein
MPHGRRSLPAKTIIRSLGATQTFRCLTPSRRSRGHTLCRPCGRCARCGSEFSRGWRTHPPRPASAVCQQGRASPSSCTGIDHESAPEPEMWASTRFLIAMDAPCRHQDSWPDRAGVSPGPDEGRTAAQRRPDPAVLVTCRADPQRSSLRHAVRHHPSPGPRLNWADRALLGLIPKARSRGLLLVTPDTILRWHRDIIRRRWTARPMRGKTGRPANPAASVMNERPPLAHRLALRRRIRARTSTAPRWLSASVPARRDCASIAPAMPLRTARNAPSPGASQESRTAPSTTRRASGA